MSYVHECIRIDGFDISSPNVYICVYICMYGFFSWTDLYTSSFDYPVVLIDRRESECNNSS